MVMIPEKCSNCGVDIMVDLTKMVEDTKADRDDGVPPVGWYCGVCEHEIDEYVRSTLV